ncbi:MAG: NAD-dependent epimerase/dehydratase family protein [Candidatus Odinarchaeum yellowstonii]|uniref:NAD-dependent epimerase/dehydratase family protein n=1 Tax=Odinarchaeota yellowstonii (strain LCB_4) TaxID=1841599 RepID=A0AAF0D2K2_ODILC|nr:MAG: NAD-dependent epimerase/dehydratase family protein [Candidatus Odinarchaeum yellowstonii]
MRILVTGGAGFIGSNLVRRLRDFYENVDVLDNFTTGNLDNLKGLTSRIKIINSSLKNIKGEDLAGYDYIFHLGMPSSSPMYKANPFLLSETVSEAVYMVEQLRSKDFKGKLILASSSSLYNGNSLPFTEDMNIKVTDYYTECRYYIERLLELYRQLYGLKYVVLRLFSVYGPREEYKGRYANMITQFLWSILKGETPTIYGDGEQTRDFIYVDDVIEAFILAAEKEVDGEIFNIGTGVQTSFKQVIEILNTQLKTTLNPRYISNPIKNYVQHTLADTRKASVKLGFKPKVDLKTGIRKICEYYSNIKLNL